MLLTRSRSLINKTLYLTLHNRLFYSVALMDPNAKRRKVNQATLSDAPKLNVTNAASNSWLASLTTGHESNNTSKSTRSNHNRSRPQTHTSEPVNSEVCGVKQEDIEDLMSVTPGQIGPVGVGDDCKPRVDAEIAYIKSALSMHSNQPPDQLEPLLPSVYPMSPRVAGMGIAGPVLDPSSAEDSFAVALRDGSLRLSNTTAANTHTAPRDFAAMWRCLEEMRGVGGVASDAAVDTMGKLIMSPYSRYSSTTVHTHLVFRVLLSRLCCIG